MQTNIKRMLAYSSIAHAGYLLLGIIAANRAGKAAILFYLLSYAVANLGALGIVALLGTPENEHDELRDFAGLKDSRPGLAALMTVFLLSLGGFPPLAGFIGKWYIFNAAVQEGYYWLAIIGVLTSVVSVFFYLRIVVMMWMTEGPEVARPRIPAPAARRPGAGDDCRLLHGRPADAHPAARAGFDPDDFLSRGSRRRSARAGNIRSWGPLPISRVVPLSLCVPSGLRLGPGVDIVAPSPGTGSDCARSIQK